MNINSQKAKFVSLYEDDDDDHVDDDVAEDEDEEDDEEEEDVEDLDGYELRQNPKKTWRIGSKIGNSQQQKNQNQNLEQQQQQKFVCCKCGKAFCTGIGGGEDGHVCLGGSRGELVLVGADGGGITCVCVRGSLGELDPDRDGGTNCRGTGTKGELDRGGGGHGGTDCLCGGRGSSRRLP